MDRRKLLEKRKQPTLKTSHKSPSLKVYYVPFGLRTHHHHSQKQKRKYYVHKSYTETKPNSAMMSGDSPNAPKHDIFEFKEDHKLPSPTTSKDAAVQIHNANTDLAASTFSEPPKEISKPPYGSETHNAHKHEDEILATTEEVPLRTEKLQPDRNYISRNDLSKVDGKSIKSNAKKEEEEEDESCGIKCLYYTLQCCECTIM